jgi:hypothetical protein
MSPIESALAYMNMSLPAQANLNIIAKTDFTLKLIFFSDLPMLFRQSFFNKKHQRYFYEVKPSMSPIESALAYMNMSLPAQANLNIIAASLVEVSNSQAIFFLTKNTKGIFMR